MDIPRQTRIACVVFVCLSMRLCVCTPQIMDVVLEGRFVLIGERCVLVSQHRKQNIREILEKGNFI